MVDASKTRTRRATALDQYPQVNAMTDRDILSFDPWGDGKGDDPYRVLRNVMVTARFPNKCALCRGVIAKGERHRAQTEAETGGSKLVKTFRFCAECCEAMPSWWTDGEKITARYSLGEQRARAERASDTSGDQTDG